MVELTAWRCPLNPGLAADRILGDLVAEPAPRLRRCPSHRPRGVHTARRHSHECASRVLGASVGRADFGELGRAASLPFSSDLGLSIGRLEMASWQLALRGAREIPALRR